MKTSLLLILLFVPMISFSQKTIVSGVVTDGITGEVMPFVKVRFQNSKIGTSTDTSGFFSMDTYYATDSIMFYYQGYITVIKSVVKDAEQTINVELPVLIADFEAVSVKAPDEWPSITLHKKVIANKPINDKEKLASYEYEVYNKVQVDINNIGENFTERGLVKKLEHVMEYLDSNDHDGSYLPVILSENVSDFYFRNKPLKKKEIVKATRISGVENVQMNQFLGDMYLDVNIYENYVKLFNKSFISPVANFARSFYKFYLVDSAFIDNQWCYRLNFTPKRTGDATFEGEMWIHDTTYAVKQFKANISPSVNINYVQDLFIEHHFDQVATEVWMLTSEKMIADLRIAKKSKMYGFYGRRHSTRKNYKINKTKSTDFYNSKETVEILDSANKRSEAYWAEIRHEPLTAQENGIDEMVDSLNNLRFFKNLKNFLYLATTGYYPLGKIEVGSIFSLFSYNPVEEFRFGLALRTSNNFSKRLELGGNIAYGTLDQKFKYGGLIRFNITPKKRGMMRLYYNYDIEQIGLSSMASSVTSTFGTLLRTGPIDKLTFVEKFGLSLEKDVGKDLILTGGFEWKEYIPLGLANYVKVDPISGINDTISRLQTSEFLAQWRWAKDEEFISGYFDRTSIRSKYPVLTLQGVFGVKDLLSADYNYQKLDLFVDHDTRIGILGRIRYGLNVGYILGTSAYPFLKVHEGNQSFWMITNGYNKMNFFEFISDKYITAYLENHWDGLFLDRVPLMKKLKWRMVSTVRAAYGQIDDRHIQEMLLPESTKQFGNTPYLETSIGIENIFNVGRVDLFWRVTHPNPGSPLGVRFRYYINF